MTRICVKCRGNHPKGSLGMNPNKDEHCFGSKVSCKCTCTYYPRDQFCQGADCFKHYNLGDSGYCAGCLEDFIRGELDPRITEYISNVEQRIMTRIEERLEELTVTARVTW